MSAVRRIKESCDYIPLEKGYRVVLGDQERCFRWFQEKFGCKDLWSTYTTIGLERAGKLKAVFVYEKHFGRSITIHLAGEGQWCRPSFLYYAFAYPFNQLGVVKCLGYIDAGRVELVEFGKNLGFHVEHLIKDGAELGDLAIISMTREQCRFLES